MIHDNLVLAGMGHVEEEGGESEKRNATAGAQPSQGGPTAGLPLLLRRRRRRGLLLIYCEWDSIPETIPDAVPNAGLTQKHTMDIVPGVQLRAADAVVTLSSTINLSNLDLKTHRQ